jgi:hypothetical protein
MVSRNFGAEKEGVTKSQVLSVLSVMSQVCVNGAKSNIARETA